MTLINTHISSLTLNINDPNPMIKRHGLDEWINKQNSPIYCLQETYLSFKDTHHLRIKGWTRVLQPDGTRKQGSIDILISEKMEYKLSPWLKYIIILNMYGPNSGTPNFIKNILLYFKTKINIKPLIVGDFNISLSSISWSSRKK